MTTFHACTKCQDYITYWPFTLDNHMKRCKKFMDTFTCDNNFDLYKCDKCNYETHLKVDYGQHLDSKSCYSSSASEVGLKQHNKLKCKRCDFVTHSKYFLKVHESRFFCWALITNKGTVKCKECDKIFKTTAGLKSHVSRLHSGFITSVKTLYKCSYCTHIAHYGNLQTHIITKHTHPSQIHWCQCTQCSYKSKTKLGLKRHINRRHSKICEYFSCSHCSYRAKEKSYLNFHVRTMHVPVDQIKWHKCDQCDYKTKHRSGLRKHMKNHVSIKTEMYQHSEHSRNINQNSFCQDNNSYKRYQCAHCNYKTLKRCYLIKHCNTKHANLKNSTVYKCSECNFKTKYQVSLRDHMERHISIEQDKVQCNECSYKINKNSLSKHMRSSHPKPYSDHTKYILNIFCHNVIQRAMSSS